MSPQGLGLHPRRLPDPCDRTLQSPTHMTSVVTQMAAQVWGRGVTGPGHQEPLAGGSGGCVARRVRGSPGASSGRPVEAAGTTLVGTTYKAGAPAIFLEGSIGLVPADQRALWPWLLWGLVGQLSVHSSPRSLGFEDGHWGAVRARTPGRDPPRGPSGQPCPGGSRGGSPRSRTSLSCPGVFGARTLLDSGKLPDACDRSPARAHSYPGARTHALARHTRPGPGGRQGPKHPPSKVGLRMVLSLSSRQPGVGVPVQPLRLDWGAAPLGPSPAPAAWLGPLSLCPRRGQQRPPQGRAQCLLKAHP